MDDSDHSAGYLSIWGHSRTTLWVHVLIIPRTGLSYRLVYAAAYGTSSLGPSS